MTTALLVIDLQNDYFDGGKMELIDTTTAAANARRLQEHFRNSGNPVVNIKHISDYPGATFFLPDSEGAEIHPQVSPVEGDLLVTKNFPNSFRNTNLEEELRGLNVKSVVICGAMSHMCIDATTRAAADLGFECTLIDDACATRDLAFKGTEISANQVQGAFMAALGAAYAKIQDCDSFLAEKS